MYIFHVIYLIISSWQYTAGVFGSATVHKWMWEMEMGKLRIRANFLIVLNPLGVLAAKLPVTGVCFFCIVVIFVWFFVVCVAGKYRTVFGACNNCPQGTYSEDGSATDFHGCTDCPATTFSASGAAGVGGCNSKCQICFIAFDNWAWVSIFEFFMRRKSDRN